MKACVDHKSTYKTMLPLYQRYAKFKNNKLRKHIINNIKENILE